MPTPADVPELVLGEDKLKEINDWLYDEITKVQLGRAEREKQWLEIEEFYHKTTLETKKDFPFENAAYLMIPLMPIYCEQIKAKINSTIWAPSDPISVKPTRTDFNDFAKPMRAFCTWAIKNELFLQDVLDDVILEHLILGSAVTKTVYTKVEERYFEPDGLQDEDDKKGGFLQFFRTIKDSPEVIHIQLADFYFPLEARSLDRAEWKAQRVRLSWNELKARERDGHYRDVDRIKSWEEKQRTDFEREREDTVDEQPIDMTEYEIYEIWFRFPLKEGAVADKLVWSFHLDSKIELRKQYSWYPMGLDPFDMLGYESQPHRIYATGVGQMVLPYQKEVSTMHNQRLDSSTLRNSVLFKRKADSTTADMIKFKMGSSIPLEDMDDLDIVFFGQQYDSTIQDEQHTLELLQQRIGMQDYIGQATIASAQSTSVLQVISEAARRSDDTIKNVRKFLGSIMIKVLLLYQKYYPEGKSALVKGEDGIFVEQVWKFPETWITNGLGITVTATTSATSKELERQNKLSLFGLITQYYGQLTQYLVQAENPELPATVRLAMLRIIDGLTTLVEDILEDFDLHNSHDFVVSLNELRAQAAETRESIPPAGTPGTPGVGSVPGSPAGNGAGQAQPVTPGGGGGP